MAELVEAAVFGAARAQGSRHVCAAVAAAAVRAAADRDGGVDCKEVAVRMGAIKEAIAKQVAGQPVPGSQRAARNVASHCLFGQGADVLTAALQDPQRTQRGRRRVGDDTVTGQPAVVGQAVASDDELAASEPDQQLVDLGFAVAILRSDLSAVQAQLAELQLAWRTAGLATDVVKHPAGAEGAGARLPGVDIEELHVRMADLTAEPEAEMDGSGANKVSWADLGSDSDEGERSDAQAAIDETAARKAADDERLAADAAAAGVAARKTEEDECLAEQAAEMKTDFFKSI